MSKRPVSIVALAGLGLLLLLSGCATQTSAPSQSERTTTSAAAVEPQGTSPQRGGYQPQPGDLAAMRQAWQRWTSLDEDDYDLRVLRRCFCPRFPAWLTKVRDGKVVSVARSNHPGEEINRRGWTMDRLFLLLRSSYGEAHSVDVAYTDSGVPRQISVDYLENTIDEEMYFQVALDRR
jgi:hypothetical protein